MCFHLIGKEEKEEIKDAVADEENFEDAPKENNNEHDAFVEEEDASLEQEEGFEDEQTPKEEDENDEKSSDNQEAEELQDQNGKSILMHYLIKIINKFTNTKCSQTQLTKIICKTL